MQTRTVRRAHLFLLGEGLLWGFLPLAPRGNHQRAPGRNVWEGGRTCPRQTTTYRAHPISHLNGPNHMARSTDVGRIVVMSFWLSGTWMIPLNRNSTELVGPGTLFMQRPYNREGRGPSPATCAGCAPCLHATLLKGGENIVELCLALGSHPPLDARLQHPDHLFHVLLLVRHVFPGLTSLRVKGEG